MRPFRIRALILVLLACPSLAQQPAPASPGGTVTGHVTCSDTQRPARFAHVMLLGVPAEITPPPNADPNAKPDAAQIKAALKFYTEGNMVQTQTDIDGSFEATNVIPGDYYVFASVPGYVQPVNIVQAALDAGADLRKSIPDTPIVHVIADRSVRADLLVNRGAAISGKVVWDDGSPATQVTVTVASPKAKEKVIPPQFSMLSMGGIAGGGGTMSFTDDLGHFRISGLAPGDYLIRATLQTHSQFAMTNGVMNMTRMMESPLVVFAPAAFHQADAKPVTLHTAEDRSDEEVTIKLGGLHSVSGRIASAEDHHGLNAALVLLRDTQDKDFGRSANVDAHGNFTVTFVPPGTYDLIVSNAADTEPSTKKPTAFITVESTNTLRSYQDGKQSVVVSDNDITGQNIELAPAKTTKKDLDPDLEELLKN
jgi:hypothetical protein